MPLTVADNYDAELRRLNERFRAATGIRRTDAVLDIGCGAGQTSREAGRAAVAGTVLGLDVSEALLERARALTAAEGLHNVSYELGDAQVHPLEPNRFDVVISRFGTMFFADPVAAFSNIARAARPEARLVLLVWQSHDRNEWAVAIQAALSPGAAVPEASAGPDPFSQAQRSDVEATLAAAGFGDVRFEEVHEPVFYGPDAESAYEIVSSMSMTRDVLSGLEASEVQNARSRLRQLLTAHLTNEGVALDARAWLVTARRR